MTQGSQPELGKLIPHLGVKADQPNDLAVNQALEVHLVKAGKHHGDS